MATTQIKAAAGHDKYGHFVSFEGDFATYRSAMPNAETAARCAASHDLLAACSYPASMEVPGVDDPEVDDSDDVDINVTIGWLREVRDAMRKALA